MQPNIIFIMSDDHAARAISAYGGGLNHTPNLDRLANEGMRLDRCYVTNSICTPSRAAILTGTYNHVNQVTTLDTHIDNRLPNVARHLRQGGYQTAIFGKWHLGEGKAHEPTGFDQWAVVPGQGVYYDPVLIDKDGPRVHPGYATDIITDISLDFIKGRDPSRPFFLMCHHKAPHRNFVCDHKHEDMFEGEDLPLPESFSDDYANRAVAAAAAKMRIRSDMTYDDLGLIQPEGGSEVGDLMFPHPFVQNRKVPDIEDGGSITLIDARTGKNFTFTDPRALAEFKYQRYIKRYLRTVQSIDDNVGRLLDYLDAEGLVDDTIVIYTSDQGFFLGEHGWFDKRFMYEESLQMPFLVRYPKAIKPGSVSKQIAMNVDFAPTFLDYAGIRIPTYMQGASMRPVFEATAGDDWQDVAYHRYWMHKDVIHNAFAHYGIRDHRYKLIYWYNDPLQQLGATRGDEPPEWELFDCEADPHELHNRANDPEFAGIFADMVGRLDAKMAEIGDMPEHDSRMVLSGR
ncbi:MULTISPECIES: sulfatase family protein [unclassified Shinella]|uniref:sulfatase family protein n=2 Tax=Shinella TaxID=323620 RepID=UPI00225D3373|nr:MULTISPECIES: sulfatase [unclassified Shinella]CAI0333917.1 N-acetylglucosamine-6-O-sulfatase [Rhizobiaceae bacterium]CAK7261559.1 N-acetylglucosamine-6-O-sulfatase [Shinella sp. WSC3-e]MDC7259738.1 sulfatase [Shinella sp. YE25]MDC7267091.1 sulfatase [Shinella sp. HY16]MDC7273988.1 sulfatase [Shinella sp. YZ44]